MSKVVLTKRCFFIFSNTQIEDGVVTYQRNLIASGSASVGESEPTLTLSQGGVSMEAVQFPFAIRGTSVKFIENPNYVKTRE